MCRPTRSCERDAKDYDAGDGQTLRIAQVETVGETLHERQSELIEALSAVREREQHAVVALMVTDIMAKATTLYAAGDRAVLDRAFGQRHERRRRRAARAS